MTTRSLAPLLGILALIVPVAAAAARCPGGRFAIATAALTTDAPALDHVVLERRTVALGDCGPARLHARRARGGMALRARWANCASLNGTVVLKARIDRACGRMTGVVRAHGIAPWRFQGTRMPVCGNGIREGDEACDEQSACCSATCHASADPGCAPAACTGDDDCATGAYCAHDAGCAGAGTCRPRPDACIDVLEPVCGCNGRTYANTCEAARTGVDVEHHGRCDRTCGTIAGLGCEEGSFCEFPPGACGVADRGGTCLSKPEACTREYRPVCGCDGTTYGNDCDRRAVGVAKAHDGACGCDPVHCPDGQVPVDDYGDGCPNACARACEQSCDCYRDPPLNGCWRTCATCDAYWSCYEGRCMPRCGPVPPDRDQCEAPPPCTTSDDCGEGEFCRKLAGDCTGQGRCMTRPTFCPQWPIPTCGCDGKTYGNSCEAAGAGTSVAALGPCAPLCGTIAGLPCADDEFCELPTGQCEGADLAGGCQAVARACPRIDHQVCACDGTTYPNDCERRRQRAQKAHGGPCSGTEPGAAG